MKRENLEHYLPIRPLSVPEPKTIKTYSGKTICVEPMYPPQMRTSGLERDAIALAQSNGAYFIAKSGYETTPEHANAVMTIPAENGWQKVYYHLELEELPNRATYERYAYFANSTPSQKLASIAHQSKQQTPIQKGLAKLLKHAALF